MSVARKLDVVVLGAGGAGLFCGARAAARGRKTIILDHAEKLGRKILISGGGRCNFTNLGACPANYVSENEHFCRSALSRFRPEDFLALVRKHRIAFHEKKLGQQFCDESAQQIVDLLKRECHEAGAEIRLNCKINSVERAEEAGSRFRVSTSEGEFLAESVVVATGGLSIPKIGATDFGHRLARSFGLKVTDLAPALVSLEMDEKFRRDFSELSGLAVDAEVSLGKKRFRENILFTHGGLSGPAILQISLHWHPGEAIQIKILPEIKWEESLLDEKRRDPRQDAVKLLARALPARLAEKFAALAGVRGPLQENADAKLRALANLLSRWELVPASTGGYGRAEVTRGGVDTAELSSQSLEAKKIPGLFFIGEVVDVSGWLGGYNFQWAWASGAAAAEYV